MSRVRINGYSRQYILQLIKQDKVNAIFNTEDILYSIMLKCDTKTIMTLRYVNKNGFKTSNLSQLWKEKIQNKNIQLRSNRYKREFLLIAIATNLATKIVEVISLLRHSEEFYFNRLYICGDKGYSIDLSCYNFYWLNVDLKDKINPMIGIVVTRIRNEILFNIDLDEEVDNKRITFFNKLVYRDKMIEFFTFLFYHYPTIKIKMNNVNQDQLFPIDDLNITILKYWKLCI